MVLAVLVAACTPAAAYPSVPPATASSAPGSAGAAGLASDPLHSVALYDVNSEATFTLGELAADGPVLLEMMAIWCSNCRAQQSRVAESHQLTAFQSVSLDIDPNERPGDLADYSASLAFNWRFAMANINLASALRDRFGPAVLNPPSTPMVLLFPDGSIRALEFRAYTAEELAAEIAAG